MFFSSFGQLLKYVVNVVLLQLYPLRAALFENSCLNLDLDVQVVTVVHLYVLVARLLAVLAPPLNVQKPFQQVLTQGPVILRVEATILILKSVVPPTNLGEMLPFSLETLLALRQILILIFWDFRENRVFRLHKYYSFVSQVVLFEVDPCIDMPFIEHLEHEVGITTGFPPLRLL